jgi:hypothetical protein
MLNKSDAMMKEDLRKAAQERSELLRNCNGTKKEVDSQMDLTASEKASMEG